MITVNGNIGGINRKRKRNDKSYFGSLKFNKAHSVFDHRYELPSIVTAEILN